MTNPEFKWKHFAPEIILWCLRWYGSTPMSYANLSDMLQERGISVNRSTIYRWFIEYTPALRKKLRRRQFIRADSSWQLDETYVKVKGKWHYLYRAITTVLMVKRIFSLPLRALQDFIDSVFRLANVPLVCPHYTCISRRAKDVEVDFKASTRGTIQHLAIDATGLKYRYT